MCPTVPLSAPSEVIVLVLYDDPTMLKIGSLPLTDHFHDKYSVIVVDENPPYVLRV